jgi:vacuolar protein sorting-associated protein 13B
MKFNIAKNQLLLVSETYDKLLNLPFFATGNQVIKKEPQFVEICQKSSSSHTAADLKEFLDMTQNSTITEDTLLATLKKDLGISIWLQWTFTKVAVECHSDICSKFLVEFEDIIYSLDKQDVYLKLKMKVGSMNGEYYRLENDTWVKSEALNFSNEPDVTETEDKANDIFFDLTLTKAETIDVHSKWGANKKNRTHETLVEVIVKMQQIDTRIDLELMKDFMPLLNVCASTGDESENKQRIWAVSDLPLLHFESKGFRIFVPVETSVFILKIGKISVSHNIENPICRAPLRPDVYTKAAQMRILNVPGSKIEDRQYE